MEVSVIASGSNGNSCLVEHKNTAVLVDAGKSAREIESRLDNLGKSMDHVDAVLLTHGHSDHSQSIGVLSRRYNIPVFMTKDVADHIAEKLGRVQVRTFSKTRNFRIKDMKIKPISTLHDVPSCGFLIENFGLFTDTGTITRQMLDSMKKLKGILLESNHDIDMLLNGRYPHFLKHRIMSDNGHLNNFDASTFIHEKNNGLAWVLLGHLSANNNTKELVKQTFETIVKRKIDYSVLSREKESGVWEI